MRLYLATAVSPDMLGQQARLYKEAAILKNKGMAKQFVEIKNKQSRIQKNLVSTKERCQAFLEECRKEGLIPLSIKKWKGKGLSNSRLLNVEREPHNSAYWQNKGPGGRYLKVMKKHKGA